MNIKSLSLGLIGTATLTLAGSVAAQLLILLPPIPATDSPNDYPVAGQDADQGYHPADTYAGASCKQKDAGDGSTSYEHGAGYYNHSQQDTEVVCPMVSHNAPYQRYIWSDVHVTNLNQWKNVKCELKKVAPAYGGWAEYSSGKVESEGWGRHAQQLKLNPVPGGYTPSSHVYVDCEMPSNSYVGNYNQYSDKYEYYQTGNTVYGDDYFEVYPENDDYNQENYEQYPGVHY